jgi:hypothetical protein
MIAMRESLKIDGRTLSVLALVLALTPACITEPDTVDNDASNVLVQVVNMAASASDFTGAGEIGSDLLSDVCFTDEDHPPCTVFNDNGLVTLRAFPKDRTQESSIINSVTFHRYRVTFIRADGKNVQGVDVPYAFDGAFNVTVPATSEDIERGFILVRHQAKGESPLREITFNRSLILSVIAQVDFYGTDGAGRSVMVTGYVNITFADFANE